MLYTVCRYVTPQWTDHLSAINILKAIKNAPGTSVVFPVNISFIYYVMVLTSFPNVGERFTKTWAHLHTSAKKFGEKWQIHQIFW